MPPVTLRKVAELARVSTGTASFALRGVRKLRPETVARVRAAAETLGYLANPVAAALRNTRGPGKAGVSGLSVAVVFMRACTDRELLRRFASEGRRLGHFASVRVVTTGKELRQFEREWRTKGGDAVVFISGYFTDAVAQEAIAMNWARYGVVKIGNGLPNLRVNLVRYSAFRQAWEIFERVKAAGYRRVGFYAITSTSKSDDDARAGAALAFSQAWSAEGGAVVMRCFPPGEADEARCKRVLRWIREDRPDAVIGFPGGYLHYLLGLGGVRMPENIPFAGLPIDSAQAREGVSGCYADTVEQCFPEALRMVMTQLARGERGIVEGPTERVLPPEWRAGSTLPVRARPKGPAPTD